MAVLSSQLVVSLVDRVSGPARGMVAQLKALQNLARTSPGAALAAEGRRFGAAFSRFNATVATPLGLGMGALILSTQDFEKALVGVQIARIADNLESGVVNFTKLRAEAEATKEEAMALSEALRLRPAELLKAGESAAKMGLPAESLPTLMKMAGSIRIQDDSVTPQEAAEFLGSMGILFKAGDKAFEKGTGLGNYDADVTKLANQLLGVANMTLTSAGKMQEGLRQFAPLYASLGMTFAESSAMIGAMVQAGQLDIESGTALKSLGVRMLRPTSAGREAMLMAGIRREDFMDLSAVSATKAFTELQKLTDVSLSPKAKARIKKKLVEGGNAKKFLDAEWQQEFLRIYNDATGAKTAESREANMERVLMALTTAGGKVDMFGFVKMLAEKLQTGELTDAQMAAIGEGRHLSKYKALFTLIDKMVDLEQRARGLVSEYTDAGTRLWRESAAGRWEGALASLSRAFVRLRESEGMTKLVESIARLGDALAKAPPWVIEALGKALVGLTLIAPVGFAISGAAAAISMIGSAARMALIGVFALSSRLWMIAAGGVVGGIRGVAYAIRQIAIGWMLMDGVAKAGLGSRLGFLASGLGASMSGLGARVAGAVAGFARLAVVSGAVGIALAAIAAAGVWIYNNWQGLGSFMAGVGDGFMKGLGPAKPIVEGIATAVGDVVRWFGDMLGPLDATQEEWRSWGEAVGAALAWPLAKLGEMIGLLQDIGTWLRDSTVGTFLLGEREPAAASKLGDAIKGPPRRTAGTAGAITGAGSAEAGTFKPPAPPSLTPSVGGPSSVAEARSAASEILAVESKAKTVVVAVRSAMDQARAIVAAVDLQAEGQRIMQSLAAGIRAGAPAVGAAMSDAMAAHVRGAVRGGFSDGGVR